MMHQPCKISQISDKCSNDCSIFFRLFMLVPMLSVIKFHTVSIDKCHLQEPPCKVIEPVAAGLCGVQEDAKDTGNQFEFQDKGWLLFCPFN